MHSLILFFQRKFRLLDTLLTYYSSRESFGDQVKKIHEIKGGKKKGKNIYYIQLA